MRSIETKEMSLEELRAQAHQRLQIRISVGGDDRELQQLYDQVTRVFGEEACAAANDRADDRAAWAWSEDGGCETWIVVFYAAWKAELRRLLVKH